MNYTKNHHLPQWVKTDRIMMEDFNQMCLDMENGLNGVSRDAASSTGLAWDGIVRAGWSLLAARYETAGNEEISSFQGLTVNPLTSADMASTLATATWLADSGIFIGKFPELPNTILRETCTGCSNGLVNASASQEDVRTATYGFIAPVTGSVTSFRLFCDVFISQGGTYDGQLRFTVQEKNGTSWRTIQESTVPLKKTIADQPSITDVSVNVPITEGREYLFKLLLVSGEQKTGHFGFVDSAAGAVTADTSSLFTVRRPTSTAGGHTRNVHTGGGTASHALVMAFYQMEQGGGSISAALGGQNMSKISDESAADHGGRSCRRACFLASGTFAEQVKLRLSMACQESNAMHLLNYAVMFL